MCRRLAAIEKDKVIQIVAEANDRVIANTDIMIKTGPQSHVGEIGINILSDFLNISIGTTRIHNLIAQSQEQGLKLRQLSVLATNTRAKHVYEKISFRECGRTRARQE